MAPLLPTLTPTRRRVLGSAAMTMLAARLGLTGSARAQTAKESTMTTATTPRDTAQDAAASDIRPFQVEVPQADLDDLRQRLAATRLPSQELVADRSQGVQLATIQELRATGRTSTTGARPRRSSTRCRSSRPRSTGWTSTSSTSSPRTRTPCR